METERRGAGRVAQIAIKLNGLADTEVARASIVLRRRAYAQSGEKLVDARYLYAAAGRPRTIENFVASPIGGRSLSGTF
jgi:hypothetical protein